MKNENASILILDPRSEVLEGLQTVLAEHTSLHVDAVTTPEHALERLREHAWDILLVDAQAPGNEAFNLIERIRTQHPTKPEILILSDRSFPLRELHDLGVWGLLQKPFNVDEFLVVVRRLAAHAAQQRRYVEPSAPDWLTLFNESAKKKRAFPLKAEVHDVGRGGFSLFLDGDKKPEIGQIVEFEIRLSTFPSVHLQGRGLVRWLYKESGKLAVGVEFVQVAEDDERFVTAFADLFKIRAFVPAATAA